MFEGLIMCRLWLSFLFWKKKNTIHFYYQVNMILYIFFSKAFIYSSALVFHIYRHVFQFHCMRIYSLKRNEQRWGVCMHSWGALLTRSKDSQTWFSTLLINKTEIVSHGVIYKRIQYSAYEWMNELVKQTLGTWKIKSCFALLIYYKEIKTLKFLCFVAD